MVTLRILSLFLVIVLGTAVAASGDGVRGTTWGMAPVDVIEIEGDDYHEHSHSALRYELSYREDREVLGVPAVVGYVFERDRLTRVSIVWERGIMSDDAIIRILDRNHGEPYVNTEDEIGWWNSSETTYVVWRRHPNHVVITYWEGERVRRAWDEAAEL